MTMVMSPKISFDPPAAWTEQGRRAARKRRSPLTPPAPLSHKGRGGRKKVGASAFFSCSPSPLGGRGGWGVRGPFVSAISCLLQFDIAGQIESRLVQAG